MSRKKKIITTGIRGVLGLLVLLLLSCQKDDICPAGTETTPLLIIEFYDAQDPSRLKAVQSLVVQATGEPVFFGPESTNRIEIPLKTYESITEYQFTSNSDTGSENTDIIRFSYDPTPEYLNRACGYIVNYRNMDASTVPDDNNWIISEVVLQENIENEAEVHIAITH